MISRNLLFNEDNDNDLVSFKHSSLITIIIMHVLITDLESQWKMYFGPQIRRQYTKDTHWKEAEMITPTVVEKPTESQTPEEKKLKKTLDYNTSGR